MTTDNLKLTSITPDKLVEVLRKSGSKAASIEQVKADIDSGAPVNADGSINMLEYAAWLVKEMGDAY